MLNKLTKVYMSAVTVFGFAALAAITYLYPITNLYSFAFLIILAIVAETQTILIGENGVSLTIAIIICAMLTGGLVTAVWVAACSIFGTFAKIKGKGYYHIFNTPPLFTLFNLGVYVLSMSAMALVYKYMGGQIIGNSGKTEFSLVILQINKYSLPLIISIFVGIIINTVLIAVLMAARQHENVIRLWVSNLFWSVKSLFIVGLFGILITTIYVSYGWFFVILIFAPFMLARYVFVLYKDLQENYLQTVQSLATAIEEKDEYTIGHSRRVEQLCSLIAAELNLSTKRCIQLKYAALLHDIGKIGIDEHILNSSDKLTDEEWGEIRQHPEKGAHIVEDIDFLSKSVSIIRAHHERYDGTGYPKGLKSTEVPLEAMILTVADSYDAMTSTRPYRKTITHEQALAELYKGAGKQFSLEVVKAFDRAILRHMDVIKKIV
jgi:putative nucleotidyltransferase with HDIG domain